MWWHGNGGEAASGGGAVGLCTSKQYRLQANEQGSGMHCLLRDNECVTNITFMCQGTALWRAWAFCWVRGWGVHWTTFGWALQRALSCQRLHRREQSRNRLLLLCQNQHINYE